MSSSEDLICWNCSERSPPGECIHCGVLLSDPQEQVNKEKEKEVPRRPQTLEIPVTPDRTVQLELEQITNIITKHFELKQTILSQQPQFIVANPGNVLDAKFDELVTDSNELIEGFLPKIDNVGKNTDDLKIMYIFIRSPQTPPRRTMAILTTLTILSIFLAGIYNMNQYLAALQTISASFEIFSIKINGEIMINALQFTGVVVGLVLVKDFLPLYLIFSQKSDKIMPLLIPAPPIFELGTLGSIYRQNSIPKTRKNLFTIAFWGPFISWVLSVIIVIFTLSMAKSDPGAALNYGQHSIVAGGSFEPLGLRAFAKITNSFDLTSFDLTSPITQNYLLHPITLGGMAGIYINGVHMLPATHLSGGYIVRSIYGKTTHTALSYISIALLITVHWLFATFLFFIHETLKVPEVLNEVSPKPKFSRFSIVIMVLILILSFPIRLDWIGY